MTSKPYVDGSPRPYAHRDEFDQLYPVAYKPYVGIVDNSTDQPISSSLPTISRTAAGRSSIGIGTSATRTIIRPLVTRPSLNYKRNIYSDLEFKEYFDWNNMKQLLVSLFHSFVSNYSKLIFSQPFEVSKLLLQVGSFGRSRHSRLLKEDASGAASSEFSSDSDSDDDGASQYFERVDDDSTVKDISEGEISSPRSLRKSQIERAPKEAAKKRKHSPKRRSAQAIPSVRIDPDSLNTFDVVSSLISREGPRGALKAINTSFLMNALQYTIQSWICGFVSGLLGIPDPLFVEISHSPNANLSLGLSIFSHVATSMLLSQIALIRMKFIVSTSTRGVRSFREVVGKLPRFSLFKIPRDLIIPSFITNLARAFARHYPDYLLTWVLQLSKYNSPYLYNAYSLILRILGLFIKLPFETLYSRAQVNCLLHNERLPAVLRVKEEDLCVKFGGYYGYLSTLYYIVAGTRPVDYGSNNSLNQDIGLEVEDSKELNKGFGAIFRGWSVGLVQLVSRFTLNLLANEADDSSLTEEQL
ncbi:DEKNAAC103677 [Brettanomyces naardenensis]|uniref:DEKNAAC103677 n=1 Tax=Brettanomyces naardenensis TaxID=13370 RepID=A0A448YNV0_BRENA|nr:DEKNAAC103677 [Brettanomyces naardenensis]